MIIINSNYIINNHLHNTTHNSQGPVQNKEDPWSGITKNFTMVIAGH